MKIETIKIKDLREYANNAKKHPQHQIEQIIESIKEFGFNDPIAIDENNMIFEGHGRFKALQQMGVQEVPCIRITGLTDQQKKAYILVHNKLTMNTGFDEAKLETELQAIKSIDMSKYDFEVYDSKEVDELNIETENGINTITLNFNEDQYQEIMDASDYIEQTVKEFHNYGNPNKRSNLINEIIYQWAQKRGLVENE